MDIQQDGASGSGSAAPPSKQQPLKRTRNRASVSCAFCKKRRLKCSREIPCTTCISRGIADECRWHDAPSNLVEEDCRKLHADILQRLRRIEKHLDLSNGRASSSRAPSLPAENVNEDSFDDAIVVKQDDLAASALEDVAAGRIGAQQEHVQGSAVPSAGQDFYTRSIFIDRPAVETAARFSWDVGKTPSGLLQAFIATVNTRNEHIRLMEVFFNTLGWVIHTLNATAFVQESRAFWDFAEGSLHIDMLVDPAWIALAAAVLGLAARLQDEAAVTLAQDLTSIAEAGLDISTRAARPQLRTLQTHILLTLAETPYGAGPSAHNVHELAAISTARSLRLDNLGSDSTIMPAADKSVPSNSVVARQMGLRLWLEVVVMTWMSSQFRHGQYFITEDSFNSAMPIDLNDPLVQDFEYLPSDDYASSSGLNGAIMSGRREIANLFRRVSDFMTRPPSTDVDCKTMLDSLDQRFQQILAGAKEAFDMASSNHSHQWIWRLVIGKATLQGRRLRLHRFYAIQAYHGRKVFEESKRIVVESAADVLACLAQLQDSSAPMWSQRFMSGHLVPSILVLFLDQMHDVDKGSPSAAIQNLSAAELFFMKLSTAASEQDRQTGTMGLRLMTGLKTHLATRGATPLSQRPAPGKVFKNLTKRLGSEVAVISPAGPFLDTSPAAPTAATGSAPTESWMSELDMQQLLTSLGMNGENGPYAPQLQGNFAYTDQLFDAGSFDFAQGIGFNVL